MSITHKRYRDRWLAMDLAEPSPPLRVYPKTTRDKVESQRISSDRIELVIGHRDEVASSRWTDSHNNTSSRH